MGLTSPHAAVSLQDSVLEERFSLLYFDVPFYSCAMVATRIVVEKGLKEVPATIKGGQMADLTLQTAPRALVRLPHPGLKPLLAIRADRASLQPIFLTRLLVEASG